MTLEKAAQYQALVGERKKCRRCMASGLTNPALDPELCQWDSDQIGPWSQWLFDLDAEVLIVGQEWDGRDGFLRGKGKDDPRNVTNQRLQQLLEHIGRRVPDCASPSGGEGVFLTNAVLCMKPGRLGDKVKAEWFRHCGEAFLKPLIEIIRPRVVVTLGGRAYEAVMRAFERKPQTLAEAVDSLIPMSLFPGTELVPVFHCGQKVWRSRRKAPEQLKDWERVRNALSFALSRTR